MWAGTLVLINQRLTETPPARPGARQEDNAPEHRARSIASTGERL
ncbi:hypothetical protein AB0H77_17215 [Streptomyces sp. NPDC050844]